MLIFRRTHCIYIQHMVLSLQESSWWPVGAHTNCAPIGHHELSSSDSTICCMYAVYPPEDEHLKLETVRGT